MNLVTGDVLDVFALNLEALDSKRLTTERVCCSCLVESGRVGVTRMIWLIFILSGRISGVLRYLLFLSAADTTGCV